MFYVPQVRQLLVNTHGLQVMAGRWSEGWDHDNRLPYTFRSPFDLSGVA
jgi:hypothetical protein